MLSPREAGVTKITMVRQLSAMDFAVVASKAGPLAEDLAAHGARPGLFQQSLVVAVQVSWKTLRLKVRNAFGVHHDAVVAVGLLQVLPEVPGPLVDLAAMPAHVSGVGLAQVDFFKMSDYRGRLGVGLRALRASHPTVGQVNEVNRSRT